MTPAQLALARRLVAHPRWRWLEAMASDAGFQGLPDLGDYATAAILLRMAMEAGVPLNREVRLSSDGWEQGQVQYDHLTLDYVDGKMVDPNPDLGTVAATALLAAWGE